jgi:uncharacterized protein YegP (UPF0339 family)
MRSSLMAGKFELKTAKNGQFYFNLKAPNGQVVLSSEMYVAKTSALQGIESVRTNAGDDARYERRSSSQNQPYFVLKAANHQVIGSSEMYSSPGAMEQGIQSVKTNGPSGVLDDQTG